MTLMSVFHQNLTVHCYIFIVRIIARNFLAKIFFRLFLIFFAQTCSDLFIFDPKPQIIMWHSFSTHEVTTIFQSTYAIFRHNDILFEYNYLYFNTGLMWMWFWQTG